MKNRYSAIAVNDSTDLYHYVSDFVRDSLNLGLETLSGWRAVNERRRETKVRCSLPCEMDLGFPEPPTCQAEILDLSMSGCRARVPANLDPADHINEIGELCLRLDGGEALKLYGTIVQVEADRTGQDGAWALVGFCFTALDEKSRARLGACIATCERNPHRRPAAETAG
jgi:PilZ domain